MCSISGKIKPQRQRTASADSLHAVALENPISRDDWNVTAFGLHDEQTVERVFVVHRQALDVGEVVEFEDVVLTKHRRSVPRRPLIARPVPRKLH